MFGFFTAFFGSLWLGGTLLSDRANDRIYRQQVHDMSTTYEYVKKHFSNTLEEDKAIKFEMLNRTPEILAKYEELSPYITYAMGENWREHPLIKKLYDNLGFVRMELYHSFDDWNTPIYWIYHMIIADKGKIYHNTDPFGLYLSTKEDFQLESVRFAECVEKILLSKGTGLKFLKKRPVSNSDHPRLFLAYRTPSGERLW